MFPPRVLHIMTTFLSYSHTRESVDELSVVSREAYEKIVMMVRRIFEYERRTRVESTGTVFNFDIHEEYRPAMITTPTRE